MFRWPKLFRGLVLLVGASLFLITVGLLILAYRPVRGYRVQVILSDSMYPALKTGSLVFLQTLPPNQYVPGDVLSFLLPGRPPLKVTHRLRSIRRDASGAWHLQSQGDANPIVDPWEISPGSILGKVRWQLPYLGYLVGYLSSPPGFLIYTILSFFLLIWPELAWWSTRRKRGGYAPTG